VNYIFLAKNVCKLKIAPLPDAARRWNYRKIWYYDFAWAALSFCTCDTLKKMTCIISWS